MALPVTEDSLCHAERREAQREIKRGQVEGQKAVELSSREEIPSDLVKKSYWCSIA